MNTIQNLEEECVVCHKVGTDVNVPFGDYDFAHQKCADEQCKKFEEYQQSMERLNPIIEQFSNFSKKDLENLKNEIDFWIHQMENGC